MFLLPHSIQVVRHVVLSLGSKLLRGLRFVFNLYNVSSLGQRHTLRRPSTWAFTSSVLQLGHANGLVVLGVAIQFTAY